MILAASIILAIQMGCFQYSKTQSWCQKSTLSSLLIYKAYFPICPPFLICCSTYIEFDY